MHSLIISILRYTNSNIEEALIFPTNFITQCGRLGVDRCFEPEITYTQI